MNNDDGSLELSMNGFKIVRQLGQSLPWQVYKQGKLIKTFKSFYQVCKFVFPEEP